jgi:poly-gamma-glutamate synthesis protein (capsule biosynthesis protein)
MVIFYSLGNFVSTQQELPELLGGMAKFTIEKTTLNGETTVQILDPTVDPTVMHYEYDTNTYQVYMLEDYTEELASRHSVREQIGDEFTLENLKAKYEQTMNMNVEPSEKTYLLNVRFSWDGSMIDKTTGDCVYHNDSIHYWDYYNQLYSEE